MNLPRLHLVDADHVRDVVHQILAQVSEIGNAVIVGRGSAYDLSGRGDVFHVFIYASPEEKERRLKSTGRIEKDALESAETVDRERAAFIKRYFGFEWPSRHLFDLMVNSGIGDDTAVDTILHAVGRVAESRT